MKFSRLWIPAFVGMTISIICSVAAPASAKLRTPDDKYVRVANNYMRAGSDITERDYAALAKYDLLVLPVEAQNFNPGLAAALRRLNPNITILAYVPTKSFNFTWWTDELHQKLLSGIQDDWWLVTSSGQHVSVWEGTEVISTISPWQTYLPQFVKDEVMSTGYWDGVFYDEFSGNASWINGGDIDIHRQGRRSDAALIDTAWKRASINMLAKTRELLGPDAVIVTNGDSSPDLQKSVNGRMFETFPTPWEAGGTWGGVMTNYLNLHKQVGFKNALIINTTSTTEGDSADYQKMRYGLASTLMGDGYYEFDSSVSNHGQLWWYDEYDVRLGRPSGSPLNLLAPNDKRIKSGVWRRDFESGVALVNSTDQARTITFAEELEKVRGDQDPGVNDGSIVTSVTIPAHDGLVMLKRAQKIVGAPFLNGGFARFYDTAGNRTRNGFFAYLSPFEGGASVTQGDFNGDGKVEKAGASKGLVRIINADGRVTASFRPFGANFKGAINVAVADLSGDGMAEVICGAGAGGGPRIMIYSLAGKPLSSGFFAFDQKNRGGVFVAAADLYGTGKAVIVAGSGQGLTPEVRIFNDKGKRLGSFLAYDAKFRGGVRVAAADLTGDGKAEVVTAPGPGLEPRLKTFTSAGKAIGGGFLSAAANYRGGLYVAAGDLNEDGQADIVALTTDASQAATVR
jgi:hypothetical protein